MHEYTTYTIKTCGCKIKTYDSKSEKIGIAGSGLKSNCKSIRCQMINLEIKLNLNEIHQDAALHYVDGKMLDLWLKYQHIEIDTIATMRRLRNEVSTGR